MTILKVYFLIGILWSIGYTTYFVTFCWKQRQLRPVDFLIIITISITLIANMVAWPVAIKNDLQFVVKSKLL